MLSNPDSFRNLVLVGVSGTGKTRLANLVLNQNNPSALDVDSVNKAPRVSEDYVTDIRKHVRITDTVGLGDTKINFDDIIDSIAQHLQNHEIHHLFIMINPDRIRLGLVENLEEMIKILKKYGFSDDHFTLVITHCDILDMPVLKSFKNRVIGSFPFLNKVNVIFATMPEISECRAEFRDPLQRLLEVTRNEILQEIDKRTTPIKISVIKNKINYKIERSLRSFRRNLTSITIVLTLLLLVFFMPTTHPSDRSIFCSYIAREDSWLGNVLC